MKYVLDWQKIVIYDGSIGRQDSACKFDKCFVEISRNISRQGSKIITQALTQKSTNQNCYVNIFSLEFSLRIMAVTRQKSYLGRALISFPCRFHVATVASMV